VILELILLIVVVNIEIDIAKLFAFSKMAMPYRIITANHPDIPKLNTLPNPLTGLEDPSYVYTSKQVFRFH
jgi:hypothetical protein